VINTLDFAQLYIKFKHFSNECELPIAHSLFKECSECPPAAAIQNQSLLQNDANCLNINEHSGKSFHIINKTVFYLSNVGQL